MPTHAHSPYKKRISSWTNPWLIAIAVGFMLLGLPMVLWLMTYHSDIAIQMFIITWLSLLAFVIWMAKKSLDDPRFYVARRTLEQTKQELSDERVKSHTGFLRNEIEVLSRGEKTPVLDVWRLGRPLSRRHLYFSSLESSVLDPQIREIQFRVEMKDVANADGSLSVPEKKILNDVAEFLKEIVRDPYVLALRKFFDRILLQCDALREDEHHVDRPYPFLSLLVEYSHMDAVSRLAPFDPQRLFQGAELRFDGGREIQPIRALEAVSPRGSK